MLSSLRSNSTFGEGSDKSVVRIVSVMKVETLEFESPERGGIL